MLAFDHRRSQVGVADDLCGGKKFLIAARVIAVRVGVDDVFNGFVGQRFHLGDNIVVIPFELVVDQNGTFVGEQYGGIAPSPKMT